MLIPVWLSWKLNELSMRPANTCWHCFQMLASRALVRGLQSGFWRRVSTSSAAWAAHTHGDSTLSRAIETTQLSFTSVYLSIWTDTFKPFTVLWLLLFLCICPQMLMWLTAPFLSTTTVWTRHCQMFHLSEISVLNRRTSKRKRRDHGPSSPRRRN